MNEYKYKAVKETTINSTIVSEFEIDGENIDLQTVESFGDEWKKFNAFSEEEIKNAGDQYFDIVDFEELPEDAQVLDLGCGSGRWTKYMYKKVDFVDAVDPSKAIYHAAHKYHDLENIRFTRAGVNDLPFDDESYDFIISLGVLHHIPDTQRALDSLLKKLKPGGQALIYLYYALDNRGAAYRFIFFLSTLLRRVVSILPQTLKFFFSDLIAIIVYWPLITFSRIIKALFPNKKWYSAIPLSYYIEKSWNIVRNDALDRFGTPLEHRFSKKEIKAMLENCGNFEVVFSEGEPYWHFKITKLS